MNDIGLIVLTGNIIIGFFYLIFKVLFIDEGNIYPQSYRVYWKKKDILYDVFKLVIGVIIIIVWLYLMKYVNFSTASRNEDLLKYLYVSALALIIFGGFFTYYIYKQIFKVIVGIFYYFIQKRKTIVSDQLLKAIDENDSYEVIKNIKLTLQSGKYIDLGSQEYVSLLNILIKNEEYTVANELVKKYIKFPEDRGKPTPITTGNNSSL